MQMYVQGRWKWVKVNKLKSSVNRILAAIQKTRAFSAAIIIYFNLKINVYLLTEN